MPHQEIMNFLTYIQLKILGSVWFISSIAGLSALLKSGEKLTFRNVLSALLWSGLMGLLAALFLWEHYIGKVEYLIGFAILAGVGGASVLDFLKSFIFGKLGIKIQIESTDKNNG